VKKKTESADKLPHDAWISLLRLRDIVARFLY